MLADPHGPRPPHEDYGAWAMLVSAGLVALALVGQTAAALAEWLAY